MNFDIALNRLLIGFGLWVNTRPDGFWFVVAFLLVILYLQLCEACYATERFHHARRK